MLVLARLAGDTTVVGGNGEAGTAASLKTLGITSAKVSSALDNPLGAADQVVALASTIDNEIKANSGGET